MTESVDRPRPRRYQLQNVVIGVAKKEAAAPALPLLARGFGTGPAIKITTLEPPSRSTADLNALGLV